MLLLGNVDPDMIRLIRCWWSDKIIQYLHFTVFPIMQVHSTMTVTTGCYTLINAYPTVTDNPLQMITSRRWHDGEFLLGQ